MELCDLPTVAEYRQRRLSLAFDRIIPLMDSRGSGSRQGKVACKEFKAGIYPSCSLHGAMNNVGNNKWRCLVSKCNVGCEWKVEL